jgi:ABC-type antimicrobial peptide transport system permease subunit
MELMVTTDRDPLRLAAGVQAAIRTLDSTAPVTRVSTVEAELGESMAIRRFQALLLAAFAGLALVLAAVGIFGLMYHTVTRRTREIGVRMALGAQSRDVVGMVLRHGLLLTGLGIALGVAGALALSGTIRGLLFGVAPADPASYLAALGLLGGAALVACWLPARRATRVDPLVALRHE